jgi:diguanylate cyclase (GGDEF)-like protein/PAS domain S-box-containing protein
MFAVNVPPPAGPSATAVAGDRVSALLTFDAWRSAALLGVGYFIAASVSLISTRIDGDIAYCWIATAILMSRLVQLPIQRWLAPLVACAVASIAATCLFGAGPGVALPFALILTGEAAIGALLLQRFAADRRYFEDVPSLTRYLLLVGGVMPAISAFGGAAAVAWHFGKPFFEAWLDWYMVHALGTVIFSPIVMMLNEGTARRRLNDFDPRQDGGVNLAMALAMAAVVALVFGQTRLPLFFLPLLPLTLLTFRAGRFGAALGICILALGGGALTLTGHGPATLASTDHAIRALFFQFYLVITVITMLPMAVELNRRKVLVRQLEDSEAMFHLMAERSGDVLLNLDVEGRIRYCSPSIERFGRFNAAEMVGQQSLKLVAEDDRLVAAAVHGRALARPNETFVFQYRALTASDSVTWFETHTRAIVDSDGAVSGVVSSARDITHRKLTEAKLVDTANSDAMTGLSNRRQFDEKLRHALYSPDRAGCLAIIDIDFFKRVNDGHGHLAGDEVLKAVAARLQPMVRANDLVARIGGEEFGLVLWGLQPADADKLCQRLREDIAERRIAIGTTTIAVTVSIGISDLAAHETLPALFAAADAALYRAKAEGRNCVRLAA